MVRIQIIIQIIPKHHSSHLPCPHRYPDKKNFIEMHLKLFGILHQKSKIQLISRVIWIRNPECDLDHVEDEDT